MPQLNPAPWFSIAMFAWVVLLFIILPSLQSHLFPNEPSPQELTLNTTNSWNWSWH